MPGQTIAVIGLGVTGSATLCRLALRGIRATGIEQFEPGHDRGSSHGATRMIRLAHFENPSYVPMLRRACALWRELESLARQTLIVSTGIVEIGPPDGMLVPAALAAARRHELPHELLDSGSLMRRFPGFKLPPSFAAVLHSNGGYIEAPNALRAYLRIAEAAGAAIRTNETVIAIEPQPGRVRIRTDRGEITTDAAVVAAGPWMRRLLPELRLPLNVTRQVVGWFEPDDASLFAAERFPGFLLESQHGLHYGLPAYGAMGVKVAKHHHLNESVEPQRYERTVNAADESAIRAAVREFLPAANGRLLAAETCLYTMTPDGTFILDRMPGYPHIIIASPCCGHGFKFSPLIGEIAADLAMNGETAHDVAQFRLQRFG
jgi:sarcosine oxidase